MHYLDDGLDNQYSIDIQGGGSDLIFPHHEMSAAQSKAISGKEFARAYVHSGMIGLDGEKMSKSKEISSSFQRWSTREQTLWLYV